MDFDLILDYLGHWGRYQLLVMILCGLAQFFGGVQFASNIFFYPNATSFSCACNELTLDYESQVPIPQTSEVQLHKFITSRPDISEQIMLDFDLVNNEGVKVTIYNSVFGLGAMLGSVGAGMCADKFGRKRVMTISTVMLLVSSISTSITLNFGIFCSLRFITAIAVSGVLQTGYIMVLEVIGTSKRPLCMGFMQLVFISGKLFLSLIAYHVASWRTLELVISLPAVVMLIYYWCLPESIRWLIFKGIFSKAMMLVKKAARWNKVTLPTVLLKESAYDEIDGENVDFIDDTQECFGPFVILRSPEVRKWSLIMCIIWLVNSMVYYDISSNNGNLSQNIFVNFAIVSAAEIPAVLLAVMILYFCERRHTTCFIMVFGAVFSFVTAFIPPGHPLVCGWIDVLGKIFISASYTMIYLYSAEIFPTNLRGTTTGLNTMFFYFGGILAPFIFELKKVYCPLPSILFAVTSVISGVFALKLPERISWQLPETVGESVAFGVLRNSGITRMYRPRSYTSVPRSNLSINEETNLVKQR